MRTLFNGLSQLLALLFIALASPSALATLNCNGPSINVNQAPYNVLPAVQNQNVGAYDEDVLRTNVMTAVVARYRIEHGPRSIDPGKTFKITYKDRTKECGVVTGLTGSVAAVPIPGTRRDAPGDGMAVENTSVYLRQFNQNQANQLHGTYQVCYDYYSNGELTATQCSVQVW